MATSLTDLIAAVLDVEPSTVTAGTVRDDIDEWDSLAQLGVVSALEETYNVTLSSAEMKRCSSVQEIQSVLSSLGVQV
jgi:acyl carrier protein